GLGFVASLARPGGNITGLSTFSPELSGKRLELVKESVSKLSRVAVFGTSATADTAQVLKGVERAAGGLRVKLQYVDVVDPKHINTAFQSASKGGTDRAGKCCFYCASDAGCRTCGQVPTSDDVQ